jgi:hypothetical protein
MKINFSNLFSFLNPKDVCGKLKTGINLPGLSKKISLVTKQDLKRFQNI